MPIQGDYDNDSPDMRYRGMQVEKLTYTLETLLPGRYSPKRTQYRPHHIHVKIWDSNGNERLTTQLYFKGDEYFSVILLPIPLWWFHSRETCLQRSSGKCRPYRLESGYSLQWKATMPYNTAAVPLMFYVHAFQRTHAQSFTVLNQLNRIVFKVSNQRWCVVYVVGSVDTYETRQ